MEFFEIIGGKRLSGKLQIESAKNAVLPMMAASVLTKDKVIIKNCPCISDVYAMIDILKSLGVDVRFEDGNLIICAKNINSYHINENLSSKLRSSVFMLGGLLSVFKKAEISQPGGCKIGKRPINIHVDGLEKLGINCDIEDNFISCSTKKIVGNKIVLKFPSVGATENLMLASVFAEGETVIINAAKEPEIKDLMKFLNSMGAKISGGGTGTVYIEGVKSLHGTEYTPIGDRIEAGTYIIASAITGGEIEISNVKAENILPLLNKLCNYTCKVVIKNDIIYYKRGGTFSPMEIITGPHPDFPTDLQPIIASLCSVIKGKSVIYENVFENRFSYITELSKMGAKINVCGNNAVIDGVDSLIGTDVNAKDLRGGAALIVAGLKAEGITTVSGTEFIDRGYTNLEKKLLSLGAEIRRIKK